MSSMYFILKISMVAFLFVSFSYGSDRCSDAMKIEALEGYAVYFENKANRYSSEADNARGLGVQNYLKAEAENAINMSIRYREHLARAGLRP